MCGIFGQLGRRQELSTTRQLMTRLFQLSAERGSTSSGISLLTDQVNYSLKKFETPLRFVESADYSNFWDYFREGHHEGAIDAVLGQCRLATDGSPAISKYNQPILCENLTGLLNGIITEIDGVATTSNEWHSHTNKDVQNDSLVFFNAVSDSHENRSLKEAVVTVFEKIKGSATFCIASHLSDEIVIGTNTGSLFVAQNSDLTLFFASEFKFLREALGDGIEIQKVPAGRGLLIQLEDFSILDFSLSESCKPSPSELSTQKKNKQVLEAVSTRGDLKLCSRCILPETYPYIHFDESGVCNYCNHYEKQVVLGEEKLEEYLSQYRSKDGSPDCLVGLSGGRDSCYGLYVLKEKFGMTPIAYTFDWGLTTDISRRNQALVCGKLGVEHIIRAPDVIRKRRFVRKNVEAWFQKPHLGMIPLFQAGDKEFYLYGRKLRQELGIDLTVLCSGYQLEQREFMIGFAGVNQPPVRNNHDFYYHPKSTKVKLALRYMQQYLLNPAYLNESLYESLRSFVLSFLQKANFLYLFKYLPWDEQTIETVLRQEFGWEADKKFGANQWRMGDGQTSFNNLLYLTMAGFSEFDVFRSNQVREGLISREEALELAQEDNEPKYDNISYFCQAIGLSFDEVIARVNQLPKIYEPTLSFRSILNKN